MINKIKQILMILTDIFIAKHFYDKKMINKGILQEQNKQTEAELANIKEVEVIRKRVYKKSKKQLEKECSKL